ncbi:Acid phosphatase [Psilocybe cubensis]|uniref:Acid phosphatase n=2 Tax=Psilocybe cubensis TaxID=181762 RepID=A0ACB8GM17_PSICU|nr:Acid phosphatase [Psilocybe cubensis]KAH9476815.1 Acid phosphatase [Psilocybe cubensis]
MRLTPSLLALSLISTCAAQKKVVLTNDDGWATAQIRAEYAALQAAGFNVILSAPAINKSGTGSSTTTPTTLTTACEFNTCPSGSPATGANSTDPRINYVNAFPVDAVRFGIQTLAPKFFGSKPDFVISGSNIGTNLGSIGGSGTVGAASEAALEGIPSIAFSGSSGSQVSYTTLSDTTTTSTMAANIYTSLILKLTNQLLNNTSPILPAGISLNVNFASISSCPSASSFKFVLTRLESSSATDVTTCGTNKLTPESTAIKEGCIATVSVFNASTKADVNSATQGVVLNKLQPILGCL